MENKNPMDPISPPMPDGNNSIFNNQTPSPHPEQGNPGAFANKESNFDDITAKILEEAPPIPQANQVNPSQPMQPANAVQDPFAQTNQPQVPLMPDTNVHMGGTGKKFLNWKIAVAGVVGAIVLIIGGVSLVKGDFYWMRDILGMGIPSDAKKAISKASSNMDKLDNLKESLNLELTGNFDNKDMKMAMDLDASVKKDTAHIKFNSLSVDIPKDVSGAVDVSKINESMAGLEVISDDGTGYIKIPSLNDSWYKVDQSSLENFQDINNLVPAVFSQETDEKSTNPLTAAVAYAVESTETQSELTNYVKNIKKVKDEKIDGKSSYHYQGELDVAKAMESSGSASSSEFSSFADKYLKTKVDIYITKKEILFSKMSITLDFNMDLSEFGGTGSITVGMKMDAKMKDYNKGVSIDIPTDAKKFDEKMFEDIMGGKTVDTTDSRNTQRESDAKIVESALEAYYADNNSYPVITADSKNGEFLKELVDGKYLASPVKDPSHPTYYYSYTSTDGKGYTLTYVEENDTGITVQKITK
ncbi:hypothetical protein HGB13_02545 [bacterium]|nr:hypothetical protein [bacterium]